MPAQRTIPALSPVTGVHQVDVSDDRHLVTSLVADGEAKLWGRTIDLGEGCRLRYRRLGARRVTDETGATVATARRIRRGCFEISCGADSFLVVRSRVRRGGPALTSREWTVESSRGASMGTLTLTHRTTKVSETSSVVTNRGRFDGSVSLQRPVACAAVVLALRIAAGWWAVLAPRKGIWTVAKGGRVGRWFRPVHRRLG